MGCEALALLNQLEAATEAEDELAKTERTPQRMATKVEEGVYAEFGPAGASAFHTLLLNPSGE